MNTEVFETKSVKRYYRKIFEEFKKHYPYWSTRVMWWGPYGWDKIIVYADDGVKFVYDRVYERVVAFIETREQ